MRTTIRMAGLAAAFATLPLAAQPPGQPAPPCDESDGYVCGQSGPEDLVALGPDWVVASAYAAPGGVTFIRAADRMSYTAYPADDSAEAHDTVTYPDCPGPPDAGAFTTHGVYVAPGGGPEHTLFVVGHGARESIEVFEVDTRGEMPAVTWVGCAIAPDPIGLNSVRGLPDGGFITTNFLPRGTSMQAMMTGEPNGELWEWHTESGWQAVPGSEASGANGVELADDGETIYVAAWGSQSFFTLSRGAEPPVREEIELGFRIDNIHWARDGTLLTAGQVGQDWQVAKIDPETLEVGQVYAQPDMPAFGGGTTALEVGDALWVGSFRGDRIAVIPAAANCSRSALQIAVNAYIEAQTAGDRSLLPTAPATLWYEQQETIEAAASIVNEPLAIDFHRSILDETSCQTFTELVVLDAAHPYAIGTRLRVVAGTITELEALVTDEGDWLFNPEVTYERASAEDWSVLPPAARSGRAALVAAANAYFDQFFSGPDTVYVPWGTPCNRLEGGAYTGDGSPTDSCNAGVPSGMNISHRRFVVDEAMGAVVGFVRFGPNRIPDTHLFRLENGRIRYVHTLSVCPDTGCEFN